VAGDHVERERGVGDEGLPVGVQVLAPALGEPLMFRVAAALEGALR
jgi:aspartyl-tRNA(Asn)/glutamyl-tRNA(Gln) amidotransferase subunit A